MSMHVHIYGEGPDLVLLHGWALHSGVFDALLPVLTRHYRVHCIDLPGHGQSSYDNNLSSLAQLSAAVQPHVPANAMVMGWSLGGQVALQLAQNINLRALIVVSTTPKFVADPSWAYGMQSAVFAQFFARLQQNLTRTVEDFLRLQVRGDLHAASTFASLTASLLQYPADPAALQRGLEILRDADERAALPSIDVPTLVVAGEYDRITHPDACSYLAEQLPRGRYCLIKRAGHAAFISHREQFLNELHNFLSPLTHVSEVAAGG